MRGKGGSISGLAVPGGQSLAGASGVRRWPDGVRRSLIDVWREVEEEIGVPAEPVAMRFAGVRVRSSEGEPGTVDREIQDVFLWRRDDPLDGYKPNPAELEALVEVRIADVLALFRGREEGFEAVALEATDRRERAVWLEPGEFLPSVDRYPFRVAVAALAAMRGDEWIAV